MGIPYDTRLPPDLRALKQEIEQHARSFGLDFYETIFEVLDAEDLNEVAAYGGFPTRYPHWSFGMSYEELKKGYDYGLSKIYEMVINNDPCYAYLMRCNHTVDQKLVMAHVYGHCDFFKNNAYFAHTNRKMMDEMANHGVRIRRYAEKHGEDDVENFVDRCMSIDDLIDIHSTAIRRRADSSRYDFKEEEEESLKLTRFKSKGYMDDYINPPSVLRAEEEERRKLKEQKERKFPEQPEKDVLLFLIEHAPLKPWQRDILSIIRDEAYYFAPQGQTKVINEGWACTHKDTYLFTNRGVMKVGDLVERRLPVQVSDGQDLRQVYDWVCFPDRETVKIRTRRGLELEGSTTHRLLLPDGQWRRLDELAIGDRVTLRGGGNLWASEPVPLNWTSPRRSSQRGETRTVGVASPSVAPSGLPRPSGDSLYLQPAVWSEWAEESAKATCQAYRYRPISVPRAVDERLAAFLGYLIGDGHISVRKRTIGLTTGDDSQAEDFIRLAVDLFAVRPVKKWDKSKWRVRFSSVDLQDFLIHLGFKTGPCAREKTVPDAILRSPKPIVAAFLRALYDCDGYGGKSGIILRTSSTEMSKMVQLLLLNFGILSTRGSDQDDCWHVQTLGRSAEVFYREIGFGLQRKQEALRQYLDSHHWYKEQPWDDEIVAVERRRAGVYDISVEETHRYAAQGFINHNSYWHSTIMTERALEPWECIDYADHHSGTMATQRGRINPYKLGIELLRYIERCWNTGRFGKEYEECDDLEKKRTWDKKLGLGRQKIFEVRRVHNDITFIDTFLTPEFCQEHKMFSYAFQEQTGNYVIESREFEQIKKRLLFSLTNFGKPWIYVVDGNYRNRGELLLRHEHNGIDLRLDRAADTLANVQFLWSRPVHLQTVIDDKPSLMSYDGSEHSIRTLGEADDPRKHSPGKTH